MKNKSTKLQWKLVGFSFLLFCNSIAALSWSILYFTGRYTDWWVPVLISISFIALIANITDLRKLISKNKQ